MSKEAMKMALEALGLLVEERSSEAMDDGYKAIKALEEALAKQEQGEPVAKYSDIVSDGGFDPRNKFDTTPQQPSTIVRTWIGLSVFEINDLVENTEYEDYHNLVERTETKLKEKNT